jgi:hypothetical protein
VLAVLKDREADKQPVISRATPSEIQAYTALLQQSGGSYKSREQLQAFIEAVRVCCWLMLFTAGNKGILRW